MRINSQLPVAISNNNAITNQKTGSPDSSVIKSVPSVNASLPAASSDAHFENVMAGDRSSRFHRIDDLSANAQLALQAYQNTEAMATDNPRNQLIGVDVFA